MNEPTVNSPVNKERTAIGDQTSGRLIFTRGAANVTLQADPTLPQVYHPHFEHHVPVVTVENRMVTVQYRALPLIGWLVSGAHEPHAAITLNGAMPWEIEVRGGASTFLADLRWLPFRALDVLGGASQVMLTLPAPANTVFVHIAGGVSNLIVRRPRGAALRLHVHGGMSNLSFDGRQVNAVGVMGRWESPNYAHTRDRYDIRIGGGASDVLIASE